MGFYRKHVRPVVWTISLFILPLWWLACEVVNSLAHTIAFRPNIKHRQDNDNV